MDQYALIVAVLLSVALIGAGLYSARRKPKPKPPEVLKGFAQLSKYELDSRGWKSGLSAETQGRLVMLFSIGPADHLTLAQERERHYEEMRSYGSV